MMLVLYDDLPRLRIDCRVTWHPFILFSLPMDGDAFFESWKVRQFEILNPLILNLLPRSEETLIQINKQWIKSLKSMA